MRSSVLILQMVRPRLTEIRTFTINWRVTTQNMTFPFLHDKAYIHSMDQLSTMMGLLWRVKDVQTVFCSHSPHVTLLSTAYSTGHFLLPNTSSNFPRILFCFGQSVLIFLWRTCWKYWNFLPIKPPSHRSYPFHQYQSWEPVNLVRVAYINVGEGVFTEA